MQAAAGGAARGKNLTYNIRLRSSLTIKQNHLKKAESLASNSVGPSPYGNYHHHTHQAEKPVSQMLAPLRGLELRAIHYVGRLPYAGILRAFSPEKILPILLILIKSWFRLFPLWGPGGSF